MICLQKGCRNPVHLNMYMPCIIFTNHFYFWLLILYCSDLQLFRFLNFIPFTLLWIVAIYTRVFHFPVYIGCIYSLNRYCILVRPSDLIIILISLVHFFIILFFFGTKKKDYCTLEMWEIEISIKCVFNDFNLYLLNKWQFLF